MTFTPRQKSKWFRENKDRATFEKWYRESRDLLVAIFYVFGNEVEDLSEQARPWTQWRGRG